MVANTNQFRVHAIVWPHRVSPPYREAQPFNNSAKYSSARSKTLGRIKANVLMPIGKKPWPIRTRNLWIWSQRPQKYEIYMLVFLGFDFFSVNLCYSFYALCLISLFRISHYEFNSSTIKELLLSCKETVLKMQ